LTATTVVGKSRARPKPVPGRPADDAIKAMSEVLKLMADKSRLKILITLARDGEMNVSDLCKLLHQSQPAVSHHLTLMRIKGLVGFDRRGKNNYYYLDSSLLRELLERFFGDFEDGPKRVTLEDFSLTFDRGTL
jgi:ArsR family transcriptional regulator